MANELSQQKSLVTVVVDGVNYGTWETRTGSQITADHQKVRLGGMGPEVVVPAAGSRDNVTVSHVFDAYMSTKYKTLDKAVSNGASMSVTWTPMRTASTPLAEGQTVTGYISRCSLPDADANSNDVAYIELEMVCNEQAS